MVKPPWRYFTPSGWTYEKAQSVGKARCNQTKSIFGFIFTSCVVAITLVDNLLKYISNPMPNVHPLAKDILRHSSRPIVFLNSDVTS